MLRTLLAVVLAAFPALVLADEIRFEAADGVGLFADWHEGSDPAQGPTVILFHQARGSARGEYPWITEKLVGLGYNVLAVDQRSGGDRFGAPNRTVEAQDGAEYGYCEAYPDLLAAIAQARKRNAGPLAVWGSSYSAGLVLNLAGDAELDLAAALAFSPAGGGPMVDCAADLDALRTPTIAFRPESEMVHEHVAQQADALRLAGVDFHVVPGGVHGSSMLVPDRSSADIEATWALVERFLTAHLQPDS